MKAVHSPRKPGVTTCSGVDFDYDFVDTFYEDFSSNTSYRLL